MWLEGFTCFTNLRTGSAHQVQEIQYKRDMGVLLTLCAESWVCTEKIDCVCFTIRDQTRCNDCHRWAVTLQERTQKGKKWFSFGRKAWSAPGQDWRALMLLCATADNGCGNSTLAFLLDPSVFVFVSLTFSLCKLSLVIDMTLSVNTALHPAGSPPSSALPRLSLCFFLCLPKSVYLWRKQGERVYGNGFFYPPFQIGKMTRITARA